MKTEEAIEQLREQREGMTNIMLDMLSCISSERENAKKLAEACRQFMSCASTSPQMDCKTVVYRWNPAKLNKAYKAALVALRPNTHKNNRNTKGTRQ